MSNGLEVVRLDPELKGRIECFTNWARSLVIRSVDDRERAINELKGWKGYRSRIVAFFNEGVDGKPGMKPSAYATWKVICDAESAALKVGDQAEKVGKEAILAFDREQEDKRLAEQRRLQAIVDEQARREREKLEQQAARQRQIEEDARAKAEAARKAAEEASAADRTRLLREAEAAERKAAAAAVKVEAKEEQAAEIVAPVVQVASAVPKVKGSSTSVTWKARVINEFLVPREYLMVNQKALDDFAKDTSGSIPVLGVEFYPQDSLSIRK